MDSANDHAPLEPRLPTTDDLLLLCRRLNEAGAKYAVLSDTTPLLLPTGVVQTPCSGADAQKNPILM